MAEESAKKGKVSRFAASVATAAVLATGNVHAQESKYVPTAATSESQDLSSSTLRSIDKKGGTAVDKLVNFVGAAGQFAVIGDTGHENVDLMRFIAKDETMAGLAKQGVKHLFLEIHPAFQGIADKVAKGEMSPEDYAKARTKIIQDEHIPYKEKERDEVEGDIIASAAKYGIKVHCAEQQEKTLQGHSTMSTRLGNVETELMNAAEKNIDSSTQNHDRLRALVHGLTGGMAYETTPQKNIVSMYTPIVTVATSEIGDLLAKQQHKLEIRFGHDADVANFARQEAGGEKSVVVYGAGHGRVVCDLNDQLGAPRLDIYGTKDDVRTSVQQGYMMGYNMAPALDISTGQLMTKEDLNQLVIKKVPVLPESYRPNVCKAPSV